MGAVAKYLPSQDNVSFPVQVKLLESFLKHEFIGGVRAGPSYASREREFVRTQNAYASASGAQKQPGKPRQPRWTKTPQGCRELRVAQEHAAQANPDVVDWDSGVLPSPIGSTHPKPPAMSSEGFAFGEAGYHA